MNIWNRQDRTFAHRNIFHSANFWINLWNNKRIPDVYDNSRLDKSSRIWASLLTRRPALITVVLWCTLIIHADPITLRDHSIIIPGQCSSAEVSTKKPTNALYRISMDGVGSAFDFIRGIWTSCNGKNSWCTYFMWTIRSCTSITAPRVYLQHCHSPHDLAVWLERRFLASKKTKNDPRIKSDCNNQRNRGRLEFSIDNRARNALGRQQSDGTTARLCVYYLSCYFFIYAHISPVVDTRKPCAAKNYAWLGKSEYRATGRFLFPANVLAR
jgi:hypothetical protein